jgi:hypothetical protein
VQNWHAPTSVKELRSFLGLVGYYRKFIRHFGMISSPLTDLLNKAYLFVWTNEQDMAFQTLKQALVQALVLALPDFSKVFYIETNACEYGVGAVLIPKGHPMAFVSKALGLILRDISTYEKEYIAILMSNEQWRSYLQFGEFIVATDYQSLSHLNEQRLHTHWQQKVFSKLLGLNYRIVYKKGVENKVADALSRVPCPGDIQTDACCLVLSSCTPKWLEEVMCIYEKDTYVTDIIAKLTLDKDAVPNFTWHQGFLRYKSRVWVGSDQDLQQKLITACHSSVVGWK